MSSRVSSHGGQFDIDVPVDRVHAGEVLWGWKPVALTELCW